MHVGELLKLENKGYLLIAFHVGNEKMYIDEFFGKKAKMEFTFFDPDEIVTMLKKVGFEIEEVIIRHPYKDIEHQSKKAYITAKN